MAKAAPLFILAAVLDKCGGSVTLNKSDLARNWNGAELESTSNPEDGSVTLRVKQVKRLTSLVVDQRIRVVHPEHPMLGEAGTVRKTRRPQDQAWVEMDRDLPGDMRTFPATDTRHERFTLLWPDECAEVPNA